MTVWGVVALVIGSGAFTEVVRAVIAAIKAWHDKKAGKVNRLDEIDAKVEKLIQHDNEQYLSLLRLTIMADNMPMSERLIAGKKYLELGGNGDVKHFYQELEDACNNAKGA